MISSWLVGANRACVVAVCWCSRGVPAMPKRARKSKNAPAAKRKMSTPAAKKNARGNYSRQGRQVRRPRSRSTSVEPAVPDEEEDSDDMAIDSDDESENEGSKADGEEEEDEDKEEDSDGVRNVFVASFHFVSPILRRAVAILSCTRLKDCTSHSSSGIRPAFTTNPVPLRPLLSYVEI